MLFVSRYLVCLWLSGLFVRGLNSIAAFRILALLIVPMIAAGQSGFGYPRRGFAGIDDFYGSGFGGVRARHGYNDMYRDPYYDDYFGYRRQPCPRYQPIQLSDWKVS